MSIKQDIEKVLIMFNCNSLRDNCIRLFKTLGYNTDREDELIPNSFQGFKDAFIDINSSFNKDVALSCEWKKVEFLFQLTEEELKFKDTCFKRNVCYKSTSEDKDKLILESYLFFAIELIGDNYTRGQLSDITREVNKLFKMPVMLIFKYSNLLTLSVIDRRLNKINNDRDVLERVTLIKDISIDNPNRAHVEIIASLQLVGLGVNSFNELHEAWRKILNISELNKRFYTDITLWFYNAITIINLWNNPKYIKNKNEVKKNFLVRLISRILFCWFLKEKGLIDKELLELVDYSGNRFRIVKDVDKLDFLESNSYYRGVLQNVFFKALNQAGKNNKYDFAWRQYLPDDFDYNKFISIPYINGGTFDAFPEDNAGEDIDDKDISIPNSLFYGDGGLNSILYNYKFTIEENTPLEEDIALDPELLGLVFENLLAELDPNLDEATTKSIRRLTGSYYTPRKVIDYMVNEALYAYLNKYFKEINEDESSYKQKTYNLIYQNRIDTLDKDFCIIVVDGLDKIRILDPACGSGAFPMGMLQRMVHVLKLVDPGNDLWIEKQLERFEEFYWEDLRCALSLQVNDYTRKLGIIKNCIYGIDIQPLAVQITKLRFFISLLIDQKMDKKAYNLGITPMPNLETKLICANSLRDIKPNLMNNDPVKKLRKLREKYYQHSISHIEKDKLAYQIAIILNDAFPNFTNEAFDKQLKDENVNILKEWIMHGSLASPFFNLKYFFTEIAEMNGFDIIIGNPPYGGAKISDEIQREMGLGSKDIYGAFISKFLCSDAAPLKPGGILAYIVSDTFMTIKTHKQLRQQMMENVIHKMIRTNPDTFNATVNTAIIICERRGPKVDLQNNFCQMVDMTNISFHKDYDRFIEILNKTIEDEDKNSVSSGEYAIYYYPQSLIRNNSNLPFFVASPKLFALMQDCEDVKKEWVDFAGDKVQVKKVRLNGKEIRLAKLEQIAEVKQGLATGDNDSYLFQNPEARGSYRSINDYRKFLLTENDLIRIRMNENLKAEVIEKGISVKNEKSPRYFQGRYIIPYDKGGESSTNEGWLPNYHVPTNYFIDWSEGAVNRMRTLTIAERIRINNENKVIKEKYKTQTAGVLRNVETYFNPGITFSRTGYYSPTFRIGSGTVYDTEGSTLFLNKKFDLLMMLGILCSKLSKYLLKNFIGHTVHCQVEELKDLPTITIKSEEVIRLIKNIMEKQNQNSMYDFSENEQRQVDKLLYEQYGLSDSDINEVETWYSRKYPRLS